MKKLRMQNPPRPASSMRRVARSRTDTATDLVRLEFEAARLERELAQAALRKTTAERALDQTQARIRACVRRLAPEGEGAPPGLPRRGTGS